MAAPDAQDILKVGIAQIAPVWLDRAATLEKAASYARYVCSRSCRRGSCR